MAEIETQWPELFALAFIILGFIISIFLLNPLLSYISIFLSGFICGRVYYLKRHKEPIFPFVIIIISFLLGYIFGSFWANRLFIFIFFVLGFYLSYYLHMKKIFAIFKSQNFLK